MAAEITTEPVTISPYTIGTGVPAREVFCTPLKLKDNCGSSSELNFCGSGNGNNNSETPCKTNEAPTYTKPLANAPAFANPNPVPIPLDKA